MKKHIVCLGDSNTHGYCADPTDCAEGGGRFNEEERWPCLLQKRLGGDYLILEEGLNGRTTVFPDPIGEGLDAISVIHPLLKTHQPVDLLVVMLGTNDTKERFSSSPYLVGRGMERLVRKAMSVDCWGEHAPRVLIVAPPPIGEQICSESMGPRCAEISRGLAAEFAQVAKALGQDFMDANGCEFNEIDCMHLTRRGHGQLAERMAEKIREMGI